VLSGVLLFAIQIVAVQESLAAGGKPLLLLVDAETPGTAVLVAELDSAGYEVTSVLPEFSWNGDNPPPGDFECVVHLNGATNFDPLPVSAQTALVEYVRNGGAFVGSQWNGFERAQQSQVDMNDLVLQLWPHPDNCFGCSMTWTQVPGYEDHPVLEGVPSSFTFFADGHDGNVVPEYEEDPPVVLMTSQGGGSAVIVREFGAGRLVHFASAANTVTGKPFFTLQDPNILTLYANAVSWTMSSGSSAPACNAPTTITHREVPVSFTATAGNSSVEIIDYDCFHENPHGKKVGKKDCSVEIDGDTIHIVKSGPGDHVTWTVVALDADGNESGEMMCEVEVAYPGKRKGNRRRMNRHARNRRRVR